VTDTGTKAIIDLNKVKIFTPVKMLGNFKIGKEQNIFFNSLKVECLTLRQSVNY